MDDFTGSCMGQKFPLIKAAKEELKGYKVPNLEMQAIAETKAQGIHQFCFFIVFYFIANIQRKTKMK